MEPKWLAWAQRLQALAQSGLAYSENPYDRERYQAVGEVAAEMAAACSGADLGYVRDLFAGQAGYATPKVDVRGAVFRGDSILLANRL